MDMMMYYKLNHQRISSVGVHGSSTRIIAGDDQKVHRNLMVRYFNPRTMAIMVVLTLSLLLLPLVLPPLPPPPVTILLVPVLILVLLILLAFSPSRIPDVAANVSV